MIFDRYACIFAAAALGACSSGASTPSSSIQPQTFIVRSGASIAPHPDRRASWISPDASSSQDLLYVSDIGDYDVNVYSFPSLKLLGRLTGFDQPQGECSDAKGNVWITNTLQLDIVEYAHGGKAPIAALADPVGYPIGCAIDPTTGNLAVTNQYDSSGSGSVIVYKDAGGTPTPYGNSNLHTYFLAGYDSSGDLYVDGTNAKDAYVLAVLPHKSSSLSLVALKGGTIYYPGTVAFVGSTLVLGDQACKDTTSSCLYQASVKGYSATITGTIPLDDSCDVVQAWVSATQIAAGDYTGVRCSSKKSSVQLWSYPAGGSPVASAGGVSIPVGTTLSQGAARR